MIFVLKFNLFGRLLKAFDPLVMSKMTGKVFYAVGRGKEVGIFDSWKECKEQTEGVQNAKFRKFYSYKDAEDFVTFWKNYSSPVKQSLSSENLVSKVASIDGSVPSGRQEANEISFAPDAYSQRPEKKIRNQIQGHSATNGNCTSEDSFCVLPYTSPLSTTPSCDFTNISSNKPNKHLKVPSKFFKSRNSADEKNRFSKDGTRLHTLQSGKRNFVLGFVLSIKQRAGFKKKTNRGFQKPLSSVPSSRNSSLDNSDMFHVRRLFATSAQSILPSNSFAKEKSSESCSEMTCCNSVEVLNVEKEKDIQIISEPQKNSFLSNRQILEISETLTSCLNILVLVLEILRKQNTNAGEKMKNFLEDLQWNTSIDTNTNVNPQMEPQESAEMSCEDTKNFEVQPVRIQSAATQGQTSLETQSSQIPYSHLSPAQMSSFEERNEKNADVIALNLRLDSFERRFDTCLKEIGAITAEISRIKSDVKDLKESLSSTPKKGSTGSPEKAKDGKVQTTLCFDSSSAKNTSARSCSGRGNDACSEESGINERRNLKRKLSRSNSFEKSKRSADDDVDDLLSRMKTEKVDYTSFTLDENDYVEVYTDGSALSNGKGDSKAGIGIWFGDNHPLNVAEPVVGPPTNNTAEIQAARVAVQLAVNAGITKLKIFTDSEFLINCATKWIHRWEKNGWTLRDGGPVKNRKELEKLQKAASKISIRWEKVAAHSNIKGNEAADRLANEGALKYE